MMAAGRAKVALIGVAVGPGYCVVEVGVDAGRAAAGCGAGGIPGADEVAEYPAGPVPVLAMPVIARVLGDRREAGLQPTEELLKLAKLGG